MNGWTALALPDDTSNPNQVVHHQGNDRVSGIYFAAPDKGFVVSQEASPDEDRGGAVFTSDGTKITSIAFSGNGTAKHLLGSIDFTGIQPTPDGYIAMAYGADVIHSVDGGKTFTIDPNAPDTSSFGAVPAADQNGIEAMLGVQVSPTADGDGNVTTMVLQTGRVTVSDKRPGAIGVTYTDTWAPDATSPIPDPATLTDQDCVHGPMGSGQPQTRDSVYISPDRQLVAFTSNVDQVPLVCVSTDAGKSFQFGQALAVDDGAQDTVPSGVMFPNPKIGIVWTGVPVAGAYIQRTTDGGKTWNPVALPKELVGNKALQLPAGFFAPDGVHGWIAGTDVNAGAAVLITTADAGATWSTVPGVADAVAAFKGGKLFSGFALDATHIWLGGEGGLLMHN